MIARSGRCLASTLSLKDDDARDGVDAALAERAEHAVEVLDDDGPEGTRLERGRHLGAIGDQPAVALDVDHDGVELRPVDQLEHAVPDAGLGDAVVGEIGGADALRLERDVDIGARGGNAAHRVAGRLDDERGLGRDLEGEAPVGVRHSLVLARPDGGAPERRAPVGVEHRAADAVRRGGGPGTCGWPEPRRAPGRRARAAAATGRRRGR